MTEVRNFLILVGRMLTVMHSKIFLDTNILIHHTFKKFDEDKHLATKRLFAYLVENSYQIFISSQIIREFYAISTNSKFFDKPLSVDEAILKINEFENSFVVLEESYTEELKRLCKKYEIVKQKVHDTNIVATMIENRIELIATFNRKDFIGFNEIGLFEL